MIAKPSALVRRGFEPNSLAGFLFAAACILAAALVRWLLGMWFGATLYFVAFFPAVIIAALFAGFWPGMFALVLSVAIGIYFFIPSNLLAGLPPSFLANLGIYVGAGLTTVWLGHLFRSAIRQLETEKTQRELILKEVEHRARNVGALGAAIVHFSLQDDKETADLINSRMQTLQATNDLILRAPEMQPDIGAIVRHELAAYDLARCRLSGEIIPLRSDIARSVALIVHELATNAVKYGGLSGMAGRVDVSWVQNGNAIHIDWKETGGPKTAQGSRVGFGTRLIDTTVKGLNGTAERKFGENGFSCRLVLRT